MPLSATKPQPLPMVMRTGGIMVTAHELPAPKDVIRWTPQRKHMFSEAVKHKLLSKEEFLSRYSISESEFRSWMIRAEQYGPLGLRGRKFDIYPLDETAAKDMELAMPLSGVATFGNLTVDFVEKSVSVGGQELELTGREYETLELLAMREGQPVSKEMFFTYVYRDATNLPDMRIFDVFVCKVRKIIAAVSDKKYIKTVWGRGFALIAPLAQEPVS